MSGRSARLDALQEAVEQLAVQVQLLTASVDDLTIELQWRNRNVPDADAPSPFVLTSMPADPCAEEWAVNSVPPRQVAELKNEEASAQQAPSGRLFD